MEHSVRIQAPLLPVGKEDVVFVIKADDTLYGKLKVSRGGIAWISGGSPNQRSLSWERLADLVEREVRPERAGPRHRKTTPR